MIERGAANENDMVLAFLQAEIDSHRFGRIYRENLDQNHICRAELIDNADLADAQQNSIRIQLLKAVRGYQADTFLFAGFPKTVTWRRAELPVSELGRLRYANYPAWNALSEGSRRVTSGARNVDKIEAGENVNANIRAMAELVMGGARFPPIIVVEAENGDLIVVEGHTRATAYVIAAKPALIELIIGTSTQMKRWRYY